MFSALYRGKSSNAAVAIGLGVVICFFISSGYISYWNTRNISEQADQVTHTHQNIALLNEILSSTKDAETGQRGYILTGDDAYLAPYLAAVPRLEQEMIQLHKAMKPYPDLLPQVDLIEKHIDTKMGELKQVIDIRRAQGFEAAHAVIATDRGKNEMDIVRALMQQIIDMQTDVRASRLLDMEKAFHISIFTGLVSALLGVLLTLLVSVMIRRSSNEQQREDWLRDGQVRLASAMVGEMRIEQLGDNVLRLFAEYLDATAGAFFVREEGVFRRIATYGVPEGSETPKTFAPGDGLLGQAAKSGEPMQLTAIPDGYLYFGSGLGEGKPRHLVIVPTTAEGAVNAILEIGFLKEPAPIVIELFKKTEEAIALAVRSIAYRASLQNLLEETQRQSEELQTQSEELKVSNEELEEQSRALKESQTRLEQQQVETEQTNSQLEEQAQLLEAQRDDLERSRDLVEQKVNELEQASQYKSNFLANMSHELRTPLNSSLILAKLLADNPNRNLTEEQVLHARTIQSAGNDLLALINDILDLSKIEAGHMEIHPDIVPLRRLAKDITRLFEPVAKEKGIGFTVAIDPGAPGEIVSDRQRLEQVLKNLLSNALKFTEKGSVRILIKRAGPGLIGFAVEDTGIGIPPAQQESIFEAFRQADGTTNRKYGGTGLGLSISRELTRLLGGHIALSSEQGKGSVFTVFVPENYDATQIVSSTTSALATTVDPSPAPKPATAKPQAAMPAHNIPDDRDRLEEGCRIILVIEDDEKFARILLDLVHELGFQCLIATTADDGLIAARQYVPNAVLLDIGLPDNSGLSVLDRLKHDVRMRHIPVHVISGGDYSQTALSLGAAGYMLKPVKREKLVEALKRVEERFSHNLRRVLIVEDDDVQRESVKKLLGTHGVETIGVGTAADCLERLKEGVFDCMVLDLSLPDATGYSLLETLSREEAYSFPPVIVYTGRDLSSDEEQRLRRYSKSIIIKGARSPERLLDEVTLFLHQMVSELPAEQQRMLEKAKSRDAALEGRNILVVEDDVRNIYAVTSILEPQGARVIIARNGKEGLAKLEKSRTDKTGKIDLVLMDVMMPEMDGMTATREIRRKDEWKKLPIIMLTAKAMKDDQDRCIEAGANDYMAKPLDVEKLLSLVRVWMPR